MARAHLPLAEAVRAERLAQELPDAVLHRNDEGAQPLLLPEQRRRGCGRHRRAIAVIGGGIPAVRGGGRGNVGGVLSK